MTTIVRIAAVAILVALLGLAPGACEGKPKKPNRGTVSSLATEKPDLVVRIEERIRGKQFVGKFADSMLEQVMFLAWPGDIDVDYRVTAPGREWYLFLLEMERYGKPTTTSPRTKFSDSCRTTYYQYFAVDTKTTRVEPYTYQVTEQTCGQTVTKREGKWFEPLKLLLPGRLKIANRADLPALPNPVPSIPQPPAPTISQPTEAELAPLKRRIGTKLCRTENGRTFIGFTEAVSPDMDRIQIRVTAAHSGGMPLDFREQIVWDAPIGWRLCE